MTRKLALFQVDAFADQVFAGNPAAVIPLEDWLPDAVMQAIAAENNLSETAFLVPEDSGWGLRWFTPTVEVDLCGHATLAAAFVLKTKMNLEDEAFRFVTKSGVLTVRAEGELLTLDFPSRPPHAAVPPPGLAEALGAAPAEVLAARDLLCVFEDAETVRRLTPDMGKLAALPWFAVIATAPADAAEPGIDFVSRFFAPAKGVPEDPVTGSAHCTLTPYWSARLGLPELIGRQASARGGLVRCRARGPRVDLSGSAVLVIEGIFHL